MKKEFKNVIYVCSCFMAMTCLMLTTSCKGTDKSAAKVETKTEASIDELSKLSQSFNEAIKACGVFDDVSCDDASYDDDEMELVDFDTVTDDEGDEIPVAYFKYRGEIFEMMDIDADGVFDIAVFDSDNDGDISEDELIDITDDEITINDIAEMAGVSDDDEDEESSYADDEDEEESIVERTSRERSNPSAQRREEAAEADLPDYVNNARVKAWHK